HAAARRPLGAGHIGDGGDVVPVDAVAEAESEGGGRQADAQAVDLGRADADAHRCAPRGSVIPSRTAIVRTVCWYLGEKAGLVASTMPRCWRAAARWPLA